MPKTLYESVKASVVEYEQIKKMNERQEDKLLFRWKLITIFLAIVFIILVGVFSQLLKSITSLPDQDQKDSSFVVPLLRGVSQQSVGSLFQASNLMKGIGLGAANASTQLQFNGVQKLYSNATGIDFATLMESIRDKEHLLFLFSYTFNESSIGRFGMYAHRGYTDVSNSGGVETVKDDSSSQYSSIFNVENLIHTGYGQAFNTKNCNLFSVANGQLTMFQAFTTFVQGATNTTGLSIDGTRFDCYWRINIDEARVRLLELTGLQQLVWPRKVYNVGLEVFRLYLDQSL